MIISFFYFTLITGLIACLITIFKNIFFTRNKNYFCSAYQKIFQSTISFYNLALLQYEEFVKLFDFQSLIFLTSLELLYTNYITVKYDNIVINYLSESKYESHINISSARNNIYLYCISDESYQKISWVIQKNSVSALNILYTLNNFRIPYYSDIIILNNYIFSLPIYQCYYSLNITKIKEYMDMYNNNIYEHFKIKSNYNYYRYKTLFEEYKNNKLNLFDLLYKSKFDIFTEYMNLIEKGEDEVIIENYIKNHSKYFQTINYGNEEIIINENSNLDISKSILLNEIINNYLDYMFLELMTKYDDIINVPIYMENNTIYSKNLCYFLLLKQIRILNNSININEIFNKEKLDDIYNNLKNGLSTIEDCILDKYYSHENLNKIGYLFKKDFYKFYQIENHQEEVLFKLIKNDEDSYFYFYKHIYPSYSSLIDFEPTFFSLSQLNFYSFKSATPAIKAYNNKIEMINCYVKLIFLLLMYTWIILFFIIIYIMNKIKYLVIRPILELKDILNSKEITDETNFEYNYDDDINEFFQTCKLLLSPNKERQSNGSINSETFLNIIINHSRKNDDNQNNQNCNMILNLKMINELIDSEKMQEIKGNIIEWNWKKIYKSQQFNKNNSNNELNLIKRTKKKKKFCSNSNFIVLQKASSKSNQFIDEEENEMELKEQEKDVNDLYYYINLLLITEYLYNNSLYNDKLNKFKNTKNNNILSKIKKFLSITNNKNRDITYIWYSKIKEDNKIDFIKYYFNKGFEEIITNENNNDINNNIIK